jgi:outer membrane usher protein
MRAAALSLAVSLALASALVHAAEGPDAFTESVVEFTVNGQPAITTLVVRRDADGTLLLRATDFATLRLNMPARGALLVNGERYYRLGAEMGARVNFDATTQHADVTLPPEAFLATVRPASTADQSRVTTPALGGFVNYDLYGESTSERNSLGGIVEAGFFTPHGVGTNTLLSRDDVDGRSAVRLDTTWTLDLPARLATLRVGDAISASGAWGRSVRFGGVQFGTNFATQPTLVTTPMLAARGSAVVPSTVDVFVNGAQVASQDVPPGPFTIDHVPSITGAGQMQVVITDALGRQQILSQPYYTGPALLRAGLNEYSFELGSMREDYGYASNAYGDLIAAATFRRGFTDQITAEAHLEAQAGGPAAVGLNGAWQMGGVGILSATMAAGGADAMGWLAGFGFEHNGQRSSLFARTQFASESFAQLGTDELEHQPKQRTFVGFGLDFARYGNLQVAYGLQSFWTNRSQETIGLSHALTIGDFGYLNLIVSQSIGAGTATDVFLNWTMPFGERRSAAVSLRQSTPAIEGDAFAAVASVQQSLPAGSGVGYQVSLASNEDAQLGYSYQGRAGTASVQYARRNDTDGWRADVSGGLAITGAGVMPARRLDRSFAVVKVADYENLTVYVENQPIGRTDNQGRILLDGLRPYERNEISIDPKQLPLDASLAMPVLEITPAYRSGALVEFPVTRARPATLRLVRADGTAVPAGASVHTQQETAPVGLEGLVYLSEAAGTQQAVAEWVGGHRCEFTFARPAGTDPVPDLGTIACRELAD